MGVDVTSAVRFELGRGVVRTSGGTPGADTGRALIVPEEVLAELVAVAGVHSADAARLLGSVMGQRVSERLGGPDGVRRASVERFVGHVAAEVSVAGFGAVHLERYGRALVFVVENTPRVSSAFVAAMLEGAVSGATSNPMATSAEQQVRCGTLTDEPGTVRVLVASGRTLARVRAAIAEGLSWTEALGRLHRRGGGA